MTIREKLQMMKEMEDGNRARVREHLEAQKGGRAA